LKGKIPLKKIIISEYERNYKWKGSDLEPLTLGKNVNITDKIQTFIGSVIMFLTSKCSQAENEIDLSTTHCRNPDKKTYMYYSY
jgi:hypothetical protein